MKLLFVDESFRKGCFVILGTIIDSSDLIIMERGISNFRKNRIGAENLKYLRETRDFTAAQKLKLSAELYSSFGNYNIRLISVVLGSISTRLPHLDQYCEAMEFMIERFFFHLCDEKKVGMIILDSNQRANEKGIRTKLNEFILKTEKYQGKVRNRIFSPVLFCDDKYTCLIQTSDLMCAGIQRAVYDYLQRNTEGTLKGNEEVLKDYNEYLKLYVKYFLSYRGKISGAGIKFWI